MNREQDNPSRATDAPARARGGFTLVEAVLGTAVAVIILSAITGVMFLAQQGLAGGESKTANIAAQNRVIQMITLDLSLATSFSERTSTAVTMVVPDRTGDGVDETIRYYWSGTPGDPLTRQVNGAAPAAVAEDVHAFSLDYLLTDSSPQASVAPPQVLWLAMGPRDCKDPCR